MNLAVFVVNVLSCIACATVAFAQGDPTYPSRTVRLVVATTAGTTADVLARVLADRTSVLWRQSVVVENRPGVAGITSVAYASPDGHALLVTANGHAAVGALHKDLPLDPVKDLVGRRADWTRPACFGGSARTPRAELARPNCVRQS